MRVFPTRPILHLISLGIAAVMIFYPFHLIYGVGELRRDGNVVTETFGTWRIVHVSHLVLWGLVAAVLLYTYPKRLVYDSSLMEYRYEMRGWTRPVIFRLRVRDIIQMHPVGWRDLGYVRITTHDTVLIVRPSCGAQEFIKLHRETTNKLSEVEHGDAMEPPGENHQVLVHREAEGRALNIIDNLLASSFGPPQSEEEQNTGAESSSYVDGGVSQVSQKSYPLSADTQVSY